MLSKSLFGFVGLAVIIVLSSWGYVGHQIISGGITQILPHQLQFLNPEWTDMVRLHASDADYRKATDPDESPRHYIDIDNYPGFLQTGMIHQDLDTLIALHGHDFVYEQGVLPWATIHAYDSMVACMRRHDWNKAGLFAADLGHYVGDGHMPLHLTRNYNGQYTNQNGIHSRYETKMIGRYREELTIQHDSVQVIEDVSDYIFQYIYANYLFKDSLLAADLEATAIAGNTSSDTYYAALWSGTRNFTQSLLQHASRSLSSLIYTGWLEAGSPPLDPNAIEEFQANRVAELIPPFPNPVRHTTHIPVRILVPQTLVSLKIYNTNGSMVTNLADSTLDAGHHTFVWHPDSNPQGIYFCILECNNQIQIRKLVLIR